MSNSAPRFFLHRRALACSLALIAIAPLTALAQTSYPNKPVRLVVPFPAGGNTDQIARLIGQSLMEELGQPFVIDNKPGAGGSIGVDAVAKASADGYSLVYSTLSTYALNVGLYTNLPYDSLKDLVPVALTVQVPLVLVVPASSGIKTLPELIRLLKSEDGKANYASAGNGTSSHIACHLFTRLTGVQVQHIAYKGSGPAMTDLMAGRVAFAMDAPSVVNPMIKAGRLNAIAVAVPKRMRSLPNVPTFDEAGLKNFNAYSWNAIWAPVGTPPQILDKLNEATNKAVNSPANAKKIEESGVVAYPAMSRTQVEKFMRSEYDTWVPLVRTMGIKLD